MVRSPFYDKNGVKKGAWSPEEDNKLKAYIEKYGHWNWRLLPKFAGLSRCGKSCRLRWVNYLRPDLKRGNYTKEEEDLIIKLHEEHGNKWSLIATRLSGRTDNEIKNYWHSHLRKRFLQNPNTSRSKPNIRFSEPEISNSLSNAASSKSDASSSGEESVLKSNDNELVSSNSTEMVLDESEGDFWTQPFVSESDYYSSLGSNNYHVHNSFDGDLDYHFQNQLVMDEFGVYIYDASY